MRVSVVHRYRMVVISVCERKAVLNKSLGNYPSIFNDVIGPVMRGPSSSHCAAAVRIGLMVRDLMDGEIQDVLIEFDPHGSLATTHESQGSDMGLFGGLLGWDATDERLADSLMGIQAAGIKVKIAITPLDVDHPNTYRMTVANASETHALTAISTGGGIIEVIEIDGVRVSMAGDYYETLIYFNADGDRLLKHLIETVPADEVRLLQSQAAQFDEIKSKNFLDPHTISALRDQFDKLTIKQIAPVLPVLSRKKIEVPFITCGEMLAYNRDKDLDLWEFAVHYVSRRGAITHDQL